MGGGPRATQWRAVCRVCAEESWPTPEGWLLLRWGWDREPGQVPRAGGGGDPSWSRYWGAWCGFGFGFTAERDGRGAREGLVLGRRPQGSEQNMCGAEWTDVAERTGGREGGDTQRHLAGEAWGLALLVGGPGTGCGEHRVLSQASLSVAGRIKEVSR